MAKKRGFWTLWGGDTEGHLNAKGFYPPYEIAEGVKHVALGRSFMVCINDKDELWGTGDIPGTEGRMRLTKMMDQVRFVSCSEEAMAVLKEDGTVWCSGTLKDISGTAIASYDGWEQKLAHMKYVTAGRNTMAALSDDNVLWTWGTIRTDNAASLYQKVRFCRCRPGRR